MTVLLTWPQAIVIVAIIVTVPTVILLAVAVGFFRSLWKDIDEDHKRVTAHQNRWR